MNETARLIYRRDCSHSNCIGNFTNLYYKILPENYLDFYNRQIEYAEKNKNTLRINDRGLTYQEYVELAIKYKTLVEAESDVEYDLEAYFYAIVCHAIIETFVGQHKEIQVMNLLEKRGYKTSRLDGTEDAKYHVDICVNGVSEDFFIQIKPLSFFVAKYKDTEIDRVQHIKAKDTVKNIWGVNTYYMIYDLNWTTSRFRWLTDNEKNVLFTIEDLFDYDKDDIENTLNITQLFYKPSFINLF